MVKDEARQERLNEVYRHLFAHYGINSQIEFAEVLQIQRTALSAAMNGNKAYLTNNLFTKICAKFPNVFNYNYLVKGEGNLLMADEDSGTSKIKKQTPEIPDYVKRLCDEAARLATRNEILERQCESLIAELRDTKDKNDDFLKELRKSKEDNDALSAELRISHTQNKALISELRETKRSNESLTTKLETAIGGIEGLKNQIEMMAGAYATPQPPLFAPAIVNDKVVFPEGMIRGGRPVVTEEIAQKAMKALNKKTKHT